MRDRQGNIFLGDAQPAEKSLNGHHQQIDDAKRAHPAALIEHEHGDRDGDGRHADEHAVQPMGVLEIFLVVLLHFFEGIQQHVVAEGGGPIRNRQAGLPSRDQTACDQQQQHRRGGDAEKTKMPIARPVIGRGEETARERANHRQNQRCAEITKNPIQRLDPGLAGVRIDQQRADNEQVEQRNHQSDLCARDGRLADRGSKPPGDESARGKTDQDQEKDCLTNRRPGLGQRQVAPQPHRGGGAEGDGQRLSARV